MQLKKYDRFLFLMVQGLMEDYKGYSHKQNLKLSFLNEINQWDYVKKVVN